jgi:hypothetical protein
MAQAAKGSAPFFSPESRNNFKSDGPECLSTQTKPKSKAAGESPASTRSGTLQISKLPSSVFQHEVKH